MMVGELSAVQGEHWLCCGVQGYHGLSYLDLQTAAPFRCPVVPLQGVQDLFDLAKQPTAAEMQRLTSSWSPYRWGWGSQVGRVVGINQRLLAGGKQGQRV